MQNFLDTIYNIMLNPNHEAPSIGVIVLIVALSILVSFITSRRK